MALARHSQGHLFYINISSKPTKLHSNAATIKPCHLVIVFSLQVEVHAELDAVNFLIHIQR